jgi:hypothetical protein
MEVPALETIIGLLEFCLRSIAQPIPGRYHRFFDHHHLRFDQAQGRAQFLAEVNKIFGNNGVPLAFDEDGTMKTAGLPSARRGVPGENFDTGDGDLDPLLEAFGECPKVPTKSA